MRRGFCFLLLFFSLTLFLLLVCVGPGAAHDAGGRKAFRSAGTERTR